jgi:hypothetical protein
MADHPTPPSLAKAAQAVLDRWNSPKWKLGPTSDLMADLARALAAPAAASQIEPTLTDDQINDVVAAHIAARGAIDFRALCRQLMVAAQPVQAAAQPEARKRKAIVFDMAYEVFGNKLHPIEMANRVEALYTAPPPVQPRAVRMLTEDEERAEHDATGRGYMSVRTIAFAEAIQLKFAEVNNLPIEGEGRQG